MTTPQPTASSAGLTYEEPKSHSQISVQSPLLKTIVKYLSEPTGARPSSWRVDQHIAIVSRARAHSSGGLSSHHPTRGHPRPVCALTALAAGSGAKVQLENVPDDDSETPTRHVASTVGLWSRAGPVQPLSRSATLRG